MWQKFQKLLDRVESRWALWALIAGTGFVSARLAAITKWLDAWGPIGWGAAFLAGALVASLCYMLVAFGYARWSRAREINRIISQSRVNPLEHRFERQSIIVTDFYNRDYVSHADKSFKDCYLEGPANVLLLNCTLSFVDFRHCQIVITKDDVLLYGATVFQRCLITGGVMSNLTLLMNRKSYNMMPPEMKMNVAVINEENTAIKGGANG